MDSSPACKPSVLADMAILQTDIRFLAAAGWFWPEAEVRNS